MLFLVEMDYVRSGATPTPESGKFFIENFILPTLSGVERLIAEKKVLAGGPVAGQISLRFVVQADSPRDVDGMVSGLPLWNVAETRVTPLIGVSDRRDHVQRLMERLAHSEQNAIAGRLF